MRAPTATTRVARAALAAAALLMAPTALRAQAPIFASTSVTSIPQKNASTNAQPPPFTVNFYGHGFLPTTTASFAWTGGSGLGAVRYVSTASIVVTLPTTIPSGITSITPTACNGGACTNAVAITLTPLNSSSGSLTATPNPATVEQPTTLAAAFSGAVGAAPVLGAPSGTVTFKNGTVTVGASKLTLDPVNSSFTAGGTSTLPSQPPSQALQTADFNGDGLPDVIYYDQQIPANVHVLLNGTPAGTLRPDILFATGNACYFVNSMASGDLNKDGFADIVLSCTDINGLDTLQTYLGNGDGTFAAPTATTANSTKIALANMNIDGKLDLVAEYTPSVCAAVCATAFQVYTLNSNGTFALAQTAQTGSSYSTAFALADIDHDGFPDIAVLKTGAPSTIDIYLHQAGGGYGVAGTPNTSPNYQVPLLTTNGVYYPGQNTVIATDFNGDGLPDLAVGFGNDAAANGGVNVALNTSTPGNASFAPITTVTTQSTMMSLAAADVNGDGIPDLVLSVNCATSCVSLGGNGVFLEGDGKGNFSNIDTGLTLPVNTIGPILPVDMNADGYADLFVEIFPAVSSTTMPLTSYITSGAADAALSYTPATNGSQSLMASWPGDVNFNGTTPATTLVVNAAPDTVVLGALLGTTEYGQANTFTVTVRSSGAAGTPSGMVTFYDGTALLGTANVVGGVASLGTSTLTVGSHPINATYGGDPVFAPGGPPGPVGVTVTQATPTVAWVPSPATIPYGTALSASQLDAVVSTKYFTSVPGTLRYTPPAGAVPTAGPQTLNVTFTPADTIDFARATGTTSITVTQATPTIFWNNPAPIIYGTALGATQLNASANVPGTFVYTPGTGAILPAGTGEGLNVSFTPTDAVDYTTATGNTTINVIALAIGQLTPATATLGAGSASVTVSGTGFLANSVVNINGVPAVTSYNSPTSLSVLIPAADLLTVATLKLTVTDPTQAQTSASATFAVVAPPAAATFTGPPTVQPAEQPTLNFALTTAYPVPITGTVTLTFAGNGGVDDPAIQFSSGGRAESFTIPANSTTTPTIQLQSGTDAGTITVTLTLSAGGQIITPAGVVPITINVPASAPVITSMTLTRSGNTLTANIIGYSNTRDLSQATFTFTGANGGAISDPQVIVPATAIFSAWFTNAASQQYGSSFLYTQQFNLNNNASSIGSVTVTLTNSAGVSTSATAQ